LQTGAFVRRPAWFFWLFSVVTALFATPAKADPAGGAAEPRVGDDSVPPPRHPSKQYWYGWQGLGLDAGAITLMLTAHSAPQFESGLALYGLGAPIVHFAHGNPVEGLGSVGIRLAGIGLAAGAVSVFPCHDVEQERREVCPGFPVSISILVVTALLDAGALAYATDSSQPPPRDVGWPTSARQKPERGRAAGVSVGPVLAATPSAIFVGASGSF
jgi:hypothetical protein